MPQVYPFPTRYFNERRAQPYDHDHHDQHDASFEVHPNRRENHVVTAAEHRRAIEMIREALGIVPRTVEATTAPQPMPPPHVSVSVAAQSPRPRRASLANMPPTPPMPPNLDRRPRGVGLMIRDMSGSFRSLATDSAPRTVARQIFPNDLNSPNNNDPNNPDAESSDPSTVEGVIEQYARVMQTSSPHPDDTRMVRTWVLWDADEAAPPPLPPLDNDVADKNAPRPKPRQPLEHAVCCICYDEQYPCDIVFSGCGHMNTCLPCTQILVARSSTQGEAAPCPLCRVKSRPILVKVA